MRKYDKITITKSTTHVNEASDIDITLEAKSGQSDLPIKWECLTAFEAIDVLNAILSCI